MFGERTGRCAFEVVQNLEKVTDSETFRFHCLVCCFVLRPGIVEGDVVDGTSTSGRGSKDLLEKFEQLVVAKSATAPSTGRDCRGARKTNERLPELPKQCRPCVLAGTGVNERIDRDDPLNRCTRREESAKERVEK